MSDDFEEFVRARLRELERRGLVVVTWGEDGSIKNAALTSAGQAVAFELLRERLNVDSSNVQEVEDLMREGFITPDIKEAFEELTGEELDVDVKIWDQDLTDTRVELVCSQVHPEFLNHPDANFTRCAACDCEILYHKSSPKATRYVCMECALIERRKRRYN